MNQLSFIEKSLLIVKGFWRLRNPETRVSFNKDLIDLIAVADFIVIGVVIDKLELKLRYPDPFHPYHMALGFTLQRYCGYLNHINRSGDVLAESRGGREDGLLKNAYSHIFIHGDMYNRSDFFRRVLTSKELKLKKKASNIAGLQLADIVAYPVKQEILAEQGRISTRRDGFGLRIMETLQEKFNRHLYTGKVEGYGKVLFPK